MWDILPQVFAITDESEVVLFLLGDLVYFVRLLCIFGLNGTLLEASVYSYIHI